MSKDNLKLYYVKDDYIEYLRKFDSKVPFNKNMSRPYIGVVLERNGINYFSPLTSPKPKHIEMKASLPQIFKIDNGKLGVINLNNTIPVKLDNISQIDIESKDPKYKSLLQKQVKCINDNKETLLKKVDKLIRLYEKGTIPGIAKTCCNFKMLEQKCIEYNNGQLQTKSVDHKSIEQKTVEPKSIESNTASPNSATTKQNIIDSYKKEFPAIKHITEDAAKKIDKFNKANGFHKIADIEKAYIKAGKALEDLPNAVNKSAFKELEVLHTDLKHCKDKEISITARERSIQNSKIQTPEL